MNHEMLYQVGQRLEGYATGTTCAPTCRHGVTAQPNSRKIPLIIDPTSIKHARAMYKASHSGRNVNLKRSRNSFLKLNIRGMKIVVGGLKSRLNVYDSSSPGKPQRKIVIRMSPDTKETELCLSKRTTKTIGKRNWLSVL